MQVRSASGTAVHVTANAPASQQPPARSHSQQKNFGAPSQSAAAAVKAAPAATTASTGSTGFRGAGTSYVIMHSHTPYYTIYIAHSRRTLAHLISLLPLRSHPFTLLFSCLYL